MICSIDERWPGKECYVQHECYYSIKPIIQMLPSIPWLYDKDYKKFCCPISFFFLPKIRCVFPPSSSNCLFHVQEVHSSFPFMCVPKVFQNLSGKRVLTMEWIVGESPTDLLNVSSGSSTDDSSTHTERQRLDSKRRLLDLVCT